MSHTKEPWIIVPGGRLDPEVIITTQHRLDGRKAEICGMDVEFTGHHGDEQKANTRRIVACVNACAGIETHELELMTGRMSIASQIKACDAIYATAEAKATRRSKFARQRDDLLARIAEESAERDAVNTVAKRQSAILTRTGDELADCRTEIAALKAERDDVRSALNEWLEKTEWVQTEAKPKDLGKHRADVMNERIDELLSALEHFATWARGQHRAQSKGGHATFDMMMLRDEIDFAEAAIASVKETK